MSLSYAMLDVFANQPFQGTQIPVVVIDEGELSDTEKTSVAGEFQQSDTVFLELSGGISNVSVFDRSGRVRPGAHTILAAAYIAHERSLTEDCGAYYRYLLQQSGEAIHCYLDKADKGVGRIQYARVLQPVLDRFTPPCGRIAAALGVEEKHISFSQYHAAVVSVDHPTLIVPFTRVEHVLAARLNAQLWGELQAEVYATHILLFAPGSITRGTQFHGRLLQVDTPRDVYPPIGSVMPEFIAYLAAQEKTAEGTHTFAIDRGSEQTRRSVLQAEFDKRAGSNLKCRIGGQVIKMGAGTLFHP